MYQPRSRWFIPLSLAGAIAVSLILFALTGFFSQTRDLASVAKREKECMQEAKEYSHVQRNTPGTVTAIVGHYNERRHQCLVEISCERDENGGKSYYDQIVDPKTDGFIASRLRDVGQRGMFDSTVVMGAPVRIDDKAGAQSWFDGLMR
jgi:hypothetical protein